MTAMLHSIPSLEKLTSQTESAALEILETSRAGLSDVEAARRLLIFGPNEVESKHKLRPLVLFASKFKNPILLMLILAAMISAVLGAIVSSVIILALVFLSAIIDFVNAYKSEKVMAELRAKVNITVAILRGGKMGEYNLRELVPGDMIKLKHYFYRKWSYLVETDANPQT